jgi:pimeloyl-ACP methyl ester carboxylesterase
MPIAETVLDANGIGFHALVDGPDDGPLVVLLHGFPELARSWLRQIPVLAEAGYRVVAPDMRGYGGTDKHGPYDLQTLAADVAGLVKTCGRERATIIGHDWGAGVAWGTAFLQPQVVERLGIMNCPHPALLGRALLSNPRQLRRSWYMFAFQIPWLPEWALTRQGAVAVARALRGGSKIREVWPREALKPYQHAFLQPGAASAAIGYYRAAFRHPFATDRIAREHPITAPTRIIWGAEDQFLGRELLSPGAMRPYFAPGNEPVIELIEGAGHFVQNEAAERVNEALLRWLGRPAKAPAAAAG